MGNHHAAATAPILVLGSTGYIGKATIAALGESKVKVFAGMRDTAKAKDAGFGEGVTPIKVDSGNMEDVAKIVKENHIKKVYVIPPAHEKRTEIGIAAINGAKKGGASFVVLLSVLSLPYAGTIFADQFIPVEECIKTIGIHHTILRLPLFVDNVFLSQKSIKEEGKIYGMLEGSKVNAAITTADAGKAAAEVFAHPHKYNKKTIDLVSSVYSGADLAKAFSDATGKKVEYVQVPEQAVRDTMSSVGMPGWQVTGIIELNKLIDLNLKGMKTAGDMKEVLGIEPTPLADYVKAVGNMFK